MFFFCRGYTSLVTGMKAERWIMHNANSEYRVPQHDHGSSIVHDGTYVPQQFDTFM